MRTDEQKLEDLISSAGDNEKTLSQFNDKKAADGATARVRLEYLRIIRRAADHINTPLIEATRHDLERYFGSLERELSSARNHKMVLKMLMRYLNKDDLVKGVRTVSLQSRRRKLTPKDTLTIEEVNGLIQAAGNLRDRALIAVLWDSGARVHEVLGLTLKDIEKVPSEANGRTFLKIFFRKVKVPGEEHSVLLTEASDHLKEWLDGYPLPRVDESPVFYSTHPLHYGRPLNREGAKQIIKGAAKRAGLQKRIYPHLFRHSRTTALLRMKLPEAQIKRRLGWKPSSHMLDKYSHLVDQDVDDAMLKAQGHKPIEQPKIRTLARPVGKMVLTAPKTDELPGEPYIPTVSLSEISTKMARYEDVLQELGTFHGLKESITELKREVEKLKGSRSF